MAKLHTILAFFILFFAEPAHVAWINISCNWDAHHAVRNVISDTNDNLYIGLAGGPDGQADLWKRTAAGQCAQIGGDSTNGSWSGKRSVSGLLIDGGYLYASLGYYSPEVWRLHLASNTWEKIGGSGIASTWDDTDYQWAYELILFQGKVHVSLRNRAPGGEGALWRFDNPGWTHVHQFPASDGSGSYSLAVVRNWLYLGLAGKNNTGGRLYRYDGVNPPVMVAGEGRNGSWSFGDAPTRIVEALIEYDGKVVVALGRWPVISEHPIWGCDVETLRCAELGSSLPPAWGEFHIWNHFLVRQETVTPPCRYDGVASEFTCPPPQTVERLYVGAGGKKNPPNPSPSGARASVWMLENDSWDNQTGGNGIDGSWPFWLPGATIGDSEWVYRLLAYQNGYVTGTAGGIGGAALWRWKP